MMFFILLVLIFIYMAVSNRWLRKKYQIENKGIFSLYHWVNKTQKIIEATLLIAFLFLIWTVQPPAYLLIGYFVVLNIFRSFMEWKYEKEKKEYILTLNSIVAYAITFVVFMFYFK